VSGSRTLDWDGCFNVRDLGGLPLEDGGETRRGVLVRSDNVRKLSDEGWRSLEAHGIERIVDLRWPEELADDPPRDVHLEVVHVSLLGTYDPNFEDTPDLKAFMAAEDAAGYWAASYSAMLERHKAEVARALAAVADAEGPVCFHCAGGKDRTGIVAALVLRLAGVPVEEVAADYALTFELLAREPRPGPPRPARWAFMQNTPPEAMALALDHLEQTYGGVAGYVRACGLDDARSERLRASLRP
jgi:protein tyrosine/serine phosphatase